MATEQFTDAIALLKADHRKVEELFEKFESATAVPASASWPSRFATNSRFTRR